MDPGSWQTLTVAIAIVLLFKRSSPTVQWEVTSLNKKSLCFYYGGKQVFCFIILYQLLRIHNMKWSSEQGESRGKFDLHGHHSVTDQLYDLICIPLAYFSPFKVSLKQNSSIVTVYCWCPNRIIDFHLVYEWHGDTSNDSTYCPNQQCLPWPVQEASRCQDYNFLLHCRSVTYGCLVICWSQCKSIEISHCARHIIFPLLL